MDPKKIILAITIIIIIAVIAFYKFKCKLISKDTQKSEDYSYHFGFPTWGGVNNYSPFNPFMGYPVLPWWMGPNPYNYYYEQSIAPYIRGGPWGQSQSCYWEDDGVKCAPGYKNVVYGGRKGKNKTNGGQHYCCPINSMF